MFFNRNFSRDDSGFTSRCGQYRLQGLRHNPHVGTFSHSPSLAAIQSSSANSSRLTAIRNPNVGFIRHSPQVTPPLPLAMLMLLESDGKMLQDQVNVIKPNRISLTDLESMPLSRFTTDIKEQSDNEPPICVICLDPFADGDELRTLGCFHCFHRCCIDHWLLLDSGTSRCPLGCNVPIHSDSSEEGDAPTDDLSTNNGSEDNLLTNVVHTDDSPISDVAGDDRSSEGISVDDTALQIKSPPQELFNESTIHTVKVSKLRQERVCDDDFEERADGTNTSADSAVQNSVPGQERSPLISPTSIDKLLPTDPPCVANNYHNQITEENGNIYGNGGGGIEGRGQMTTGDSFLGESDGRDDVFSDISDDDFLDIPKASFERLATYLSSSEVAMWGDVSPPYTPANSSTHTLPFSSPVPAPCPTAHTSPEIRSPSASANGDAGACAGDVDPGDPDDHSFAFSNDGSEVILSLAAHDVAASQDCDLALAGSGYSDCGVPLSPLQTTLQTRTEREAPTRGKEELSKPIRASKFWGN